MVPLRPLQYYRKTCPLWWRTRRGCLGQRVGRYSRVSEGDGVPILAQRGPGKISFVVSKVSYGSH